MDQFEIGKLYQWTLQDASWTLYDNDGKWTKEQLKHRDIFLVLKDDHLLVKILTSSGIVGTIRVSKFYIDSFVKL